MRHNKNEGSDVGSEVGSAHLLLYQFLCFVQWAKHTNTHTRTLANDKAELSIVLIGICIALSAV